MFGFGGNPTKGLENQLLYATSPLPFGRACPSPLTPFCKLSLVGLCDPLGARVESPCTRSRVVRPQPAEIHREAVESAVGEVQQGGEGGEGEDQEGSREGQPRW